MKNFQQIWLSSLESLRQNLTEQSFNTWIKPLKLRFFDEERVVFEVPSIFFKEWIEAHYKSLIEKELEKVLLKNIKVDFFVSPTIPVDHPPLFSKKVKYTFDNFVVGENSNFAYASLLATLKNLGSFNPILIYSDIGLGKTHLIHAALNFIREKYPNMKALLVPCETFVNELIHALKFDKLTSFRTKYRTLDVLLMDDIHFLQHKKASQEEFLYTFDILYEGGKQIILTSNLHPKYLTLDEKIKNRLEMGIIAEIKKPSFETRLSILLKKVEEENVKVPYDVIVLLANEIKENIRTLEGALIKVIANSSLRNIPITIPFAKEVLKEVLKEEDKITVDKIIEFVLKYFNVSRKDLLGKSKSKLYAYPRQVAMYLIKELTNSKTIDIAKIFNKNHSTIVHAFKNIKHKLINNQHVKEDVENIIKLIKNYE